MRRSVSSVVIMLLAALLGPLTAVSAAAANTPERDGRLTFMRQDPSGFWQVLIANADLTSGRQLTHEQANSGWPVWSPDGRHIAFDSDRTDPNPDDDRAIYDVFTMRADGTGVENLTGAIGGSGDPAWSPDGRWIAFQSDQGTAPGRQGIFLMRRDGSDVQQVTTAPDGAFDAAPRFAPDGKRLVFTRYGGEEEFGNAALHTVRTTGEQLHQITSSAIGAGDADWSPDGKRIVFEAYPSRTSRGDVYVVRDDGTRLRNLTGNPASNGSADPVWSPDGTRILFLQGVLEGGELTLGLATMKANGAQRAFVSGDPLESHQPDWHAARGGRD